MKLNANGFQNQAWFVISIGYPYHKISLCTSFFQPRTSLYVFISDFKVFIACCTISAFEEMVIHLSSLTIRNVNVVIK
jgi:hypothetical protein